MERLYGEQVEQRLFTVSGIRAIDQVARTGSLITRVTFEWDSDMDLALVDVQKAVSPIASDVDVEEVVVRRLDPRRPLAWWRGGNGRTWQSSAASPAARWRRPWSSWKGWRRFALPGGGRGRCGFCWIVI
jgi:hypothetical protein